MRGMKAKVIFFWSKILDMRPNFFMAVSIGSFNFYKKLVTFVVNHGKHFLSFCNYVISLSEKNITGLFTIDVLLRQFIDMVLEEFLVKRLYNSYKIRL